MDIAANKSPETFAAELRALRGQARLLERRRDAVRELEVEVRAVSAGQTALAEVADEIGGILAGGVPAIRTTQADHLQSLTNQIDERVRDLRSRLRVAQIELDTAVGALAAIARVDQAQAAREKQIRSFRGFLGVGRPYGDDQVIIDRELPYIRDTIRLSRPIGSTTAQAIREAIQARWTAAEGEMARWATSNEVVTAGVRRIAYYMDGVGYAECSALYRTILHQPENIQTHRIDPAARVILIPFETQQVEQHLHTLGVATPGSMLAEWAFDIDDQGRCERRVVITVGGLE
jgi:cell division protein ZapA (FtsZ GTPase activity inhibitor)